MQTQADNISMNLFRFGRREMLYHSQFTCAQIKTIPHWGTNITIFHLCSEIIVKCVNLNAYDRCAYGNHKRKLS